MKELNSNKSKYKTANKIFFSLKYDDNNYSAYFDYTALVKAKVNSYYSIRYQPIDEFLNIIDIPNYVNYLFTMDPVDYKGKVNPLKISFNIRDPIPKFLFTNFYSINCAYKIQGLDKNINLKTKDNYYYQNIAGDLAFRTHMYMVNIDVEEQDFYEKKMCMLYVSNVKIDKNGELDNPSQRILIAENVPQKIIFNDILKSIKYIYQITDLNNDLAIKFILTGRACYQTIFYNKINGSYSSIKDIQICSEQQIIINHSEFSTIKLFFSTILPYIRPLLL